MSTIPETKATGLIFYGCIEDRAVNTNLLQAPGADLFFTSLKDAVNRADGINVPSTFLESVTTDAKDHANYNVHNDADHGQELDGCGYDENIQAIYSYLGDNVDSLIERLNASREGSIPNNLIERATKLAQSASELSKDKKYFSVTGAQVIEGAINAGANLITYKGDHTASELVIDERDGLTYDPDAANNPNDATTRTSFNLDADNALTKRASNFGVKSEDALMFAKLLALATVDVLSDSQAPVSHR